MPVLVFLEEIACQAKTHHALDTALLFSSRLSDGLEPTLTIDNLDDGLSLIRDPVASSSVVSSSLLNSPGGCTKNTFRIQFDLLQ